MFAALEAALVLKLDAQMRQPTVGITTTTRRPDFSFDELREAEARLWRALRTGRRIGLRGPRRREEEPVEAFPGLQYVGFLEWTTGGGTRADGHRRPHLHHLTKGIPADHPLLASLTLDDGRVTTRLEQRVSELWHAVTGDAWIVECRPLRTPAGAIAYLALHHHKRKQAPPPGFTGRRLRPSKGYYEQPISELRQLAQKLAAHERVQIAVKKAIAVEIFHDDHVEIDVDDGLTRALVEGLRSLAHEPPMRQLSIEGYGPRELELDRQELVARTVRELALIRAEAPPELVRVKEYEQVDRETGVVVRRATGVLGPLEPKVRQNAAA